MPRPKTDDLHFCKYCNSRMKSGDVCGKCDEKLKLIRRMRRIIFSLISPAEKKRIWEIHH